MQAPPEKTLWERIKGWALTAWNWTLRYPLALVIGFLVVALAVVLMVFGVGDAFNVGGVLGWLFGKDEADDNEDLKVKVNKRPKKRVDEEGEEIPIGKPDEHGWTQQEVQIVDRSKKLFRDRNVLEVKTPEGETKKIRLPKGVKDHEVDTVIMTDQQEMEVILKEAPDKAPQDLIDAL